MVSASPLQSIERVLADLRASRRLRVLGAEGGFLGLLLARAALDERAEGPVFVVARDDAAARSIAADVAFFTGAFGQAGGGGLDLQTGALLLIPEIDASPFGDVSADPRSVALRLASLYRAGRARAEGGPRIIFTSLRSLTRRVIPRAAFLELCAEWTRGGELERDEAAALLERAGYQRVEMVEDPGTYAVRGGVLDVWGGLARFPTRIELFGDEIERMRQFDPDSQRSLGEVGEFVVHPARETVQTSQEPLRTRVLKLADQIAVPSSKSRQVLENLAQGVGFFGAEALTPVYHDGLEPLWSYLPEQTRWFVESPELLCAAAEQRLTALREQHDKKLAARELVASLESFYVTTEQLAERLAACPVVGSGIDVYDPDSSADGRPHLRVRVDRNKILQSRLLAARAERGGELLRPLVDWIEALNPGSAPASATSSEVGDGSSVKLAAFLQQAEGASAALGSATASAEATGAGPWSVVLVAPNMTHAERLASMLRHYGLSIARPRLADTPLEPFFAASDEASRSAKASVRIIAGTLSEGFSDDHARVLLVSEDEIYGPRTRKAKPARRRQVGLASLSQLAVGDHVVHLTHGVGRYIGLTKMTLRGVPGDYVQLEYAGRDKLYLPVYRIHEIERFVSADARPPKLDKMGGTTFLVKAKKVRKAVRQMAEELLQIYAEREARQGHAFPEPDDLFAQFEATFPFEETDDQLAAIEDVMKDMGKPKPMDRLICGDVGFGKTEVALRAAFRAAAAGKQVAVLAPTTILVQQHFLTFTERMERFPVRVACLNRFVSAAERKRVIEGLRAGAIDIVVGTHRLLSRDVRFKDLGLLIIDEEQRFGVKQKERFKKFKAQIDVLTLTATPIPRTLHMSLLGLREISMIMTPPVDRLAVRTHITRSGDAVLEEGVSRELARGGQVFYVVPRVMGIEEHAVRLRKLIPSARVLVAHGKMPGELLEKTMLDFVEHRADILVSTNIIESGLDIPRANTMFIHRADMFGMAQLYQLRGRVGRSRLRAYCYLMVNALERLSAEARRRLEGIQRHAELGSGFNIASQDLEIRGAGEILGGRQSGQIQSIGFEAYARILGEAVAELRGDPILSEHDPEMAFDVAAYLPERYVRDVGLRLDFYRRLSGARDVDEVRDVMAELIDRFGEPPIEAEHLSLLMICKTYGRRLRALALELKGTRFSIRLGPDTPLTPRAATEIVRDSGGDFRLLGGERLATQVPAPTGEDRSRQLRACQRALADLVTYL